MPLYDDDYSRWKDIDIIVEVLAPRGEIEPPFECGIAWIFTRQGRLESPDCIPGIISLLKFSGVIEGQALVLYSMDKYMVVNSNMMFSDGSDPWWQAHHHFMSRGLDHAIFDTVLPSIQCTLHYNYDAERLYQPHDSIRHFIHR